MMSVGGSASWRYARETSCWPCVGLERSGAHLATSAFLLGRRSVDGAPGHPREGAASVAPIGLASGSDMPGASGSCAPSSSGSVFGSDRLDLYHSAARRTDSS